MGITACIISKNEEANISRCLESLIHAVDEIIIVDTGSKDKTIEIAQKYTKKIFTFDWEDDFSKARNYSIDKAKEEWILIIDCDEELTKESIPILKDLSKNKEFEGFGVIISNLIGGHESYSVQSLRLFKNKTKYRFHSPIHEQIGDVIVKEAGEYAILSSKIKFIHYGYEVNPKLEQMKTERNLRILSKIKEEQRDSLYYLHLGNEYVRRENFSEAINIYSRSMALATNKTPHYTQLCHKLIDAYVKAADFNSGLMYSNFMLRQFPDFKALLFLNAVCNLELKNYPKALESLKKFTLCKDSLSKYPNVNYEDCNDIEGLIRQLENIISKKKKDV